MLSLIVLAWLAAGLFVAFLVWSSGMREQRRHLQTLSPAARHLYAQRQRSGRRVRAR